MRITSKQRRISKRSSATHLRWTSETHKRDQKQADTMRATILIGSPTWPRIPFSNAKEVATQVIFEDGKGQRVEGPTFDSKVASIAYKRSFYWAEVGGKKRKRKSKGITDTYCSLPPWWTRVLSEEVEAGKLTGEQVQNLILRIGKTCMDSLATRTGYQPVCMAIHPDSVANLHIHFSIATISEENELMGRSASGKTGKKGLRHLGDCNLALLRMNKLHPHPTNKIGVLKAIKGDFDDVALATIIDGQLEQLLPSLKDRALTYGREHALNWVKKAEENKNIDPNALRKENKALRKENETLKGQVSDLTGRLMEAIGGEVSL